MPAILNRQKPQTWQHTVNTKIHSYSFQLRPFEAKRSGVPSGPDLHCHAIKNRARTRRAPWLAGLGTAVTGLAGWGVVNAFEFIDVNTPIVGGCVAVIPVAAGAVAATHIKDHLDKWGWDLLGGTVAAAGMVFWESETGPSWLYVLVLLIVTVVGGARLWKANPVGPGVQSLAPEPKQTPAPAPEPTSKPDNDEVTEPEVDPIVEDWISYVAGNNGQAPDSELSNRQVNEHSTTYDVALQRGKQSYADLYARANNIAGGLDVPRESLVFEAVPGASPSRARMTVIQGDPVAEARLYTGPNVTASGSSGIVHGAGRFCDGAGDFDVTMWNKEGMVPTSLIGRPGGGKSAAANVLTVGAVSTGVMNLLYIDPKGNSSTSLRKHARVAIIGPENAARAPELINAILEARRAYTVENGIDKLRPSREMPGWELLHDEFSELINRGYRHAAKAWCSAVNTVRSLALWPVAMNQAMQEVKWGDDQTRSAFCAQMVVFRMKTSSDNLVPGLEYRPNELPAKSGMAVYAFEDAPRSNVPTRWDWLPSDSDDELPEEPPFRTSSALREFDDQPDPHELDIRAIESVLGPAVDGRWVVGPGGTHSFPVEDEQEAPASTTRKPRGGFSRKKSEPAGELSLVQRDVLSVVRGGTTQVSEIVTAANAARSSVNDALEALAARNLVRRAGRGQYVEVAQQD